MSIHIRPAASGDGALILAMIGELATYERLGREAVATETQIEAALFGPAPRVFCDIAELEGAPVGFALWFYSFSTFVGHHGLYLEDLFVRETARGRGVGRALLATLARRCGEEGLGRLEWAVLDWNAPAIGFYDSLGAEALDGWTTRRLSGVTLAQLAGEGANG